MLNTLVSTESMDRAEWLSWRNKGIGGSDASVICGINRYKSPIELWMEKTGQIEPKEAGEAAYWGNIMEPIIRDEFTKRSGFDVLIEKSLLQHPEYSYMLANLDGIVIDEVKRKGYIFEAKTANSFVTGEWDMNIPENYQLQVQHYMAVTGYEGAYVAVLIGGNTFKYYFIERDEELIKILIKLEKQFWDCVIKNKMPKIDGSKACSDLLDRLYPMGKAKEIIELPNEAGTLIEKYEEYSELESSATLKKEEVINKLKDMLGDNEMGTCSGRIVSWSNITTERLNSKALKQALPDIFIQYSTASSYRRFAIK